MSWSQPKFDKFAFAGRRAKAVSTATSISFQDFSRMHVHRREKVQERRLPTPKWAIRDEQLRELLVVYLEERFYVRPCLTLSLTERLKVARASAENYAPKKRELLKEWLADYNRLSTNGNRDLSDDEAIAIFVSLKQIGGQLPINADIAREYLSKKKLHDLEIQIQNIDTDIVLTERGHAEVIVAIVYLYYRLGWDSVTVAEQLGLKSPHVRQVLARLHATWSASLSHLNDNSSAGGQDSPENLSGASSEGAEPPASTDDPDQLSIYE